MRLSFGVLAVAAMATLGGAAARADLLLENWTGRSVEFKLLNGSGQPIPGGAGCLPGQGTRPFTGPAFAKGQSLYIEGTQRANADCTGANMMWSTGRGPIFLLGQDANTHSFLAYQNRLLVR